MGRLTSSAFYSSLSLLSIIASIMEIGQKSTLPHYFVKPQNIGAQSLRDGVEPEAGGSKT
jgi:hypothetical protein